MLSPAPCSSDDIGRESASAPPVPPSSVRTLSAGLIDYAGLFPPAGLGMGKMVENLASYSSGPRSSFLGRCIVPVARLAEFEQAMLPRRTLGQRAWSLSVLAGGDPSADWAAISAFNLRHPDTRIASVEAKAGSAAEIHRLSAVFPPELELWFELPVSGDPSPLLAAVAGAHRGAKIRTGGITLDAFPPAPALAGFLAGCHRAGVVAKATAGLHHPLSGDFPLTYERGAPTGPMFGFLNLFLAASLTRAGAPVEDVTNLLLDRDKASFHCTSQAIAWRHHAFTSADLADTRKQLLRSFGSCSFTEPIEGLQALGWL